jgi:hypothetical protein
LCAQHNRGYAAHCIIAISSIGGLPTPAVGARGGVVVAGVRKPSHLLS